MPTKHPGPGREWLGLAVIALPCLLYSMDFTVLHLAVPHLSADFQPTSSQLLWITDIYGFLLAGFLITMGTLGDRIGRRRLLLSARQPSSRLGARCVLDQLRDADGRPRPARYRRSDPGAFDPLPDPQHVLDPDQRTFAIVWVASFSAGAAIGPLAGGLLLEFFWWGSVFLVAVPVMVLLLVLGPCCCPSSAIPTPADWT